MKLLPQTLHGHGQGVVVHKIPLAVPDLLQEQRSGHCPALIFHQDPEKLIQLASEVEAACRQDKLETSERLRDASRKLRQSLAKEHRRPISRPVAKVLVNLGAVMMEFNEQLTEDHRQTMLLLGESSM